MLQRLILNHWELCDQNKQSARIAITVPSVESKEGAGQNLSPRKPGELFFIAVLIVFSAGALWLAYAIAGFSKWSSPGVFPMLAAGTMLLSALFILRDAIARGVSAVAVGSESSMQILPRQVLIVTVLLVVYVLVMPTLGFLLDSGLFLFACITLLWKKPWWQTLLVTLVSLVTIHIIFRIVFQVILPQGTLVEALL